MTTRENDWTEEEWYYLFSLGNNPAFKLLNNKWPEFKDMDKIEKDILKEELDRLYFERRNLLLKKEYFKGKRLPERPPCWANYLRMFLRYLDQSILAQERVEKEFGKPSDN